MTLSFSTQAKGKPTYFVEKIISGLQVFEDFHFNLSDKYAHNLDIIENCHPKIHTIREDPNHRWKQGKLIHFVINNRTSDRFQFAKCYAVKFVQEIWISPDSKSVSIWQKDNGKTSDSFKDGFWKSLTQEQIELLSKNDGFDTINDFWQWFESEFLGKVIHWTDFKY